MYSLQRITPLFASFFSGKVVFFSYVPVFKLLVFSYGLVTARNLWLVTD